MEDFSHHQQDSDSDSIRMRLGNFGLMKGYRFYMKDVFKNLRVENSWITPLDPFGYGDRVIMNSYRELALVYVEIWDSLELNMFINVQTSSCRLHFKKTHQLAPRRPQINTIFLLFALLKQRKKKVRGVFQCFPTKSDHWGCSVSTSLPKHPKCPDNHP